MRTSLSENRETAAAAGLKARCPTIKARLAAAEAIKRHLSAAKAVSQTFQREKCHPIVAWYTQAINSPKQWQPDQTTGINTGPMTGAHRAFLNLAYNISLISLSYPPKIGQ